MQLILAANVVKRLQHELRRAGRREIGGLLMGEHVQGAVFRVVDISVQRAGGTETCFVRQPSKHKADLENFFAKTGKNYSKFNYLGEWHSHPTFATIPSNPDIQSMQSIVKDPDVGVNFLVLLVCRQATDGKLEATAMAFRVGAEAEEVSMKLEMGIQTQKSPVKQFFSRLLGL